MLVHEPLLDYEATWNDNPDYDLLAHCGPDPDPETAKRQALEWAKSAKSLEMEADRIKAFRDELRVKEDRKKADAARLRAAALGIMRAAGITKVKDAIVTASIAKGRERLAILNENDIPEQWWRIRRELAKQDIMRHIKETGEIPDGCDLEQGEDSLMVRI